MALVTKSISEKELAEKIKEVTAAKAESIIRITDY